MGLLQGEDDGRYRVVALAVVLAAAAACFLVIGLWGVRDRGHLEWGTLTVSGQQCDRPSDCVATGFWVADDGVTHIASTSVRGGLASDPPATGSSVRTAHVRGSSSQTVETSDDLWFQKWLSWPLAAAFGLGAIAAVKAVREDLG